MSVPDDDAYEDLRESLQRDPTSYDKVKSEIDRFNADELVIEEVFYDIESMRLTSVADLGE